MEAFCKKHINAAKYLPPRNVMVLFQCLSPEIEETVHLLHKRVFRYWDVVAMAASAELWDESCFCFTPQSNRIYIEK